MQIKYLIPFFLVLPIACRNDYIPPFDPLDYTLTYFAGSYIADIHKYTYSANPAVELLDTMFIDTIELIKEDDKMRVLYEDGPVNSLLEFSIADSLNYVYTLPHIFFPSECVLYLNYTNDSIFIRNHYDGGIAQGLITEIRAKK